MNRDEEIVAGWVAPALEHLPSGELHAVDPEEMAVALSLFSSAASGPAGFSEKDLKGRRSEARLVFLLAGLRPDMCPARPLSRRLAGITVENAFRTLWRHYEGYESQVSLCARVLNFYHLYLGDTETFFEQYGVPCSDSFASFALRPCVLDALAIVPLSRAGRFLPETFVALVAGLSQN